MQRWPDVATPSLMLDLDVLERNLRRMAARSARLGVALRPHVKTHKCLEIADLQRAHGAVGITVSTLEEARVFAGHGHRDLTWAFPLILGRLAETLALAADATLRLVVDSEAAVAALEAQPVPCRVWLKVDCGYHRAGVDPEGPLGEALVRRLAAAGHLRFDGILSHSGHAYHGADRAAVRAAAVEERTVMTAFAARLRAAGLAVPSISVGSTPAMAVIDHLDGVDEARPGNYVFHDLTQVLLGSCRRADCALTVLATVISSQPGAAHCVVDAGALALSKDAGPSWGPETLGEVVAVEGDGEVGACRVTSVSQEHGILSPPLPVGTRVRILPNHSCLTAACFDAYQVVRGDRIVDRWTIHRQR